MSENADFIRMLRQGDWHEGDVNYDDLLKAANIIEQLEAELEKYSEYTICDCCQSLTLEPVDAGGHMQCVSCTELANAQAELTALRKAAQTVVDNNSRAGVAYKLTSLVDLEKALQEKGE